MDSLKDKAELNGYFKHPRLSVKINGAEINETNLLIEEISVVITTGYEASICSFNVYDNDAKFVNDKLEFSSNFKSIKLGSKVEVSMGYRDGTKDSFEQVFVGYIVTSVFDYNGDEVILKVEAMDAKVLMMNNLRSEVKTDMKKYSDVVSDILKDYSAYYDGTPDVDATEELKVPIFQYDQSDYDFIVSAAKRYNYLFYVVNGKIKFTPYNKEGTTSTLVIEPGKYLHSFSREITVTNQIKKVLVRNNDGQDPEQEIEGTAVSADIKLGAGTKDASDVTSMVNEKMERLIIDHSISSPEEAQKRATAEFEKLAVKFATGEFETHGAPWVQPGKYVTIKDLQKQVDNDYFITEVEHKMSGNTYTTKCKFESNKINLE